MTEIVRTVSSLRNAIASLRSEGKSIAFVPTMGNLHRGHLQLMEQALGGADVCVASIYVNPMQFNDEADLTAYPRTPEEDLEKLRQFGVQLVFMPDTGTMYPRGFEVQTFVEVPGLSEILEGEYRPGHFRGVATVVNRLFNLVQPDMAVFGKKDYQQLLLIRRMVDDLAIPVKILSGETERESDGLALSSRNARLTPDQRRLAPGLYRALNSIKSALEINSGSAQKCIEAAKDECRHSGFEVEYLTLRRREDLLPPGKSDTELVALAAAFLGGVRLIDNLEISLNRPA